MLELIIELRIFLSSEKAISTMLSLQCDQMLKWKVAQFPLKVAQTVSTAGFT